MCGNPKIPDVPAVPAAPAQQTVVKEVVKEVPTESSQEVQEAVQKEKELSKRRRGRQSTILSGAKGLLNYTGQKTTLGS